MSIMRNMLRKIKAGMTKKLEKQEVIQFLDVEDPIDALIIELTEAGKLDAGLTGVKGNEEN